MIWRFFIVLAMLVCLALALVCFVPTYVPPEPPPKPAPPQTVVLGVGDILLGRQLGEEMARAGDYSIAFRNIRDTLTAADITFGNLEGPFCGKPPYSSSGMIFRFRPRAVESLVLAGFDVVSVANNHFGDGGDACMEFSLDHLHDAGIATAGAGRTFDGAHSAALVERNGIRFAFLGYTFAARNDHPKGKGLVIAGRDPQQVRRDVIAARGRADVIIVSLHDGAEYSQRIAKETEEFAHAAIEAGAVAVFGHHPHVPQRVEHYRDGWIFYSLGNFVFQQNTPPSARTALMARLTFSGTGLFRVEAVPAVIESFAQPRRATPDEAARVLASIGLFNPVLWVASDQEKKQDVAHH